MTLQYLRKYFHEWVYMEPQRQAETERAFKPRVYDTLRTLSTAENKSREVAIMQLQPAIDWLGTTVGKPPQCKIA